MSDSPERNTEIKLFLTRINILVSYSVVIFSVGRQLDGQKTASCDIGVSKKNSSENLPRAEALVVLPSSRVVAAR